MLSFDYLLFGYRELTVAPDYLTELVNLVLRTGHTCDVLPDGRLRISARTYRALLSKLDRTRLISVGEVRGIGGAFRSLKKHIPALLAFILCASIYLLAGNTVLDVRVSGNEGLSEAEVIEFLDTAGLSVGDRWGRIDTSEVELALLLSAEDISWVSINRRGAVAYVEIVERLNADTAPAPTAPVNIVADRDCVIDEITVYSGTAAVRVGDTVRKGDLLISGIVENERGTEYVHASGVVKGTTSTALTTSTARTEQKQVTERTERAYFAIKILNFRINLLNNYGNPPDGCVIIDDEKECVLFGKRLPVTVLSGYFATESVTERELTDAELVLAASRAHSRAIGDLVAGSDLVGISTDGEFTEGGYEMTSRVVYSTDVGEEIPINTED